LRFAKLWAVLFSGGKMSKKAMQVFGELAQARAEAFLTFADAIDAMVPALSDDDQRRLMGEEGRVMFSMATFMHRACSMKREHGYYRYRVFHQDVWKTFGCGSISQVHDLIKRLQVAWRNFIEISIHDENDSDGKIAFIIHFRVL